MIRGQFRATPDGLFREWTDPVGMGSWMCPCDIVRAEARMDSRVGGEPGIVMRDSQKTYEHHGEFTVIDRPGGKIRV